MDFKRLRIAVLSTALLCAANALAVATPKADSNTESNTESQQVSETQPGEAERLGQTVQNATITESVAEPVTEDPKKTSSYPWDDPAWEIIQYED